MEKAGPARKLYNRMRLWEFQDKYIVEPSDGSSAPFLAISRLDGSMSLTDDAPQFTGHEVPKIWTIFGVVAILKLLAGVKCNPLYPLESGVYYRDMPSYIEFGSYLFVITERECVGSYMDYPIFRIISMKAFPCDYSHKNAPDAQNEMDRELSQLLNVAETTPGLFFFYDVDIALSTQRLHNSGDESKLLPLWRQADPRFLWNSYMLEVVKDNKIGIEQLEPYLLPVMQGSFQRIQLDIGKATLDVILIARRCTGRAGTRMWRRGADSEGFVANFVETEQILQWNGSIASFVQVRGSIPLLWDQIVDLTYKPKFEIVRSDEVPQVVERHFLDLRDKYGNVLVVDLVNKHGDEGRLIFYRAHNFPHTLAVYLHFDFNRICGDIDIGWLSILYHRVVAFLSKNRYLLLNEKKEKVQEQVGVVRTNCIDCLDRTNISQSMIARKMLESQLRRLGVFSDGETINQHPNFDKSFKSLWANHGDNISIQYSGTPDLKGDIVRCGKRTIQGILKDSWSAITRYYLNNFCDGTKQDAIDLLKGHCIISAPNKRTPSTIKACVEATLSLPLILALIMTGFLFAIISLTQVRDNPWCISFSFIWASMSLIIASIGRANGRILCNHPRLHEPML